MWYQISYPIGITFKMIYFIVKKSKKIWLIWMEEKLFIEFQDQNGLLNK